MRRLRRNRYEPRIELTPLIDIMVFLMTFFIYSLVLMVRVDILPMDLRGMSNASAADRVPAATVSVDLAGNLFLNRDSVTLDELLPRLLDARAADPRTVFYLAVADGHTDVDRAPILQDIFNRLHGSGIQISLVGRPQVR